MKYAKSVKTSIKVTWAFSIAKYGLHKIKSAFQNVL